MTAPSVRAAKGGVLVEVHVSPAAGDDSVSFTGGVLRVRTRAPPELGKANAAVIRLLKTVIGSCEIVRGHGSRRKTVYVKNADLAGVESSLAGLDVGADE